MRNTKFGPGRHSVSAAVLSLLVAATIALVAACAPAPETPGGTTTTEAPTSTTESTTTTTESTTTTTESTTTTSTPAAEVSTLTAAGGPAMFANPSGVAVASDGTVYVAPYGGSDVLKFVPGSDDGPEVVASGLGSPSGVALDADGTLYIAEQAAHRILKVAPGQAAEVFAGSLLSGFEDGTGTDARFAYPTGIDVASDGTVFVADRYNNAVRAISPAGEVTTLATVSVNGLPTSVAATPTTVYVAVQLEHTVKSVDRATGTVTVLAGSGTAGSDDGIGAAASFNSPTGVAVGADGTVYVAEADGNRIRAIDPDTAGVTTLAGTGEFGDADGPLATATFSGPYGLDQMGGQLYVAEIQSGHIRQIPLP